MPAPAALTAPPQSKAASALPGMKGRPQESIEGHDSTDQAVDFASLLKQQLPAGDQFAAMQKVKTALEATPANEEVADVGALLAEITQPLAATTVPFAPVAQAAPAMLLQATPPDAALAESTRLLIESGRNTTDNAGGFSSDADSPSLSSGHNPSGPHTEFKLPETAPLALAQALTHGAHVQGATASHAPAGQAVLVAHQPVHSPEWSGEVGQNLVWMAKNGVETARLTINPPQLGPIEITLSMHKEHTTAHFVSAHSEVREVLEQALPRLRQILEGAGVQLGQADVSGQSQQQFAGDSAGSRHDSPAFRLEQPTLSSTDAVTGSGTVRIRLGNGLVDTFA